MASLAAGGARVLRYVAVAAVVSGLLVWLQPTGLWLAAASACAFALLALAIIRVLRRPRPLRAAGALAATVALGAAMTVGAAAILPRPSLAERVHGGPRTPDPGGDCQGCTAGQDITGLAVGADGRRTAVTVALAAEPGPGDGVWLWLQAAPVHPVLVARAASGWDATVPAALPFDASDLEVAAGAGDAGDGLLVITIRSPGDLGAIAVVSTGGDRAPDTGYVVPGGATVVAHGDTPGRLAEELADAVAAIESAFPSLAPEQRDLARASMARQLLPGSYRYETRLPSRPDLRFVADVAVRFPHLAQHLAVELDGRLTLAQSIYIGPDAMHVCTWRTDGTSACEEAEDLPTPITQLLGMVRDPAGVTVIDAPSRAVLGQPAACWSVVASTSDGPPEGESCTAPDGVLMVNDNQRAGQRLVLLSADPSVAQDAFELPDEVAP